MSLQLRTEYQRARRNKLIREGKCVRCQKKNKSKGTLICHKCKKKRQDENRRYYLKRIGRIENDD